MTYCVGLRLDRGLVLMSDTRTNAGVDDVSVAPKMFHFSVPGERALVVMTAGNLATTQAVVSLLEERSKAPGERSPGILSTPSMFQAARLVGSTLREVIEEQARGEKPDRTFAATLLLAGQIAGSTPRLFMIYPEGNFIEAADESPWLQIGETKYGRPILVRAFDRTMTFEAAIKLLMLSFDSTIKANLSVGPPLDVAVYERDSLSEPRRLRIEAGDPYYERISKAWGEKLREGVASLPDFAFEGG
jgi:putative proteasome-type protease